MLTFLGIFRQTPDADAACACQCHSMSGIEMKNVSKPHVHIQHDELVRFRKRAYLTLTKYRILKLFTIF